MSRTSVLALVLLHFLWQGVLIQSLLAFCLHVLRPRSSTLRYALGVTAMLLMALAPAGTALWLSLSSRVPSANSSLVDANYAASDVVRMSDLPAASELPSATASSTPSVTDALADAFASLAPLSTRLGWLLPWVVAFWLAGVVILAVRLLGGWLHLRNVVRSGQPPASHIYAALVLQLQQRLRVSRPVRIIESAFVHAPAVIGWLRPVLLIPASMSGGLTVVQLETILAHELAHVRRHDYVVNLFQAVVETLLFYHPAVWWVSRQIREEREHCCDDLAVATSGDARLYASALLQLETLRVDSTQLALAATGGGNLLHRVRRLLVPASRGSDGARWLAGIVVLCGLVFVTGTARLLNAEPQAVHEAPNATIIGDVSDDMNDRGAQPPDTVIVYRGTESLAARWDWARRTAREQGFREYWIGYVIEGDISRGWHYMNRHSPVRADGGVTFTGHMRTTDSRGLIFSGDHLGSLVPERAPSDLAILFGFSSRSQLDR
ncbi:MAG TPA: M56 family metallopeptidase, partial [Gemmatimonadaceae bacterium]|nr:M56 family metallopeptidase [Gemmatimonadaceae bacterium]